jgi:hypothetical protein
VLRAGGAHGRLRVRSLARLGDDAHHDWVLRVRPDLELLAPLALPPWAQSVLTAVAVADIDAGSFAAWSCESSQLASDQLLLLRAMPARASAAAVLGALYEPSRLDEATRRSQPPTTYPERLVWHALDGMLARAAWPGGAHVRLVGSGGEERDAYAKLKAAYPRCAYPEQAGTARAAVWGGGTGL